MVEIPEGTKKALVDSGLIVLMDSSNLGGGYHISNNASVALQLTRQIFDAFVYDVRTDLLLSFLIYVDGSD